VDLKLFDLAECIGS